MSLRSINFNLIPVLRALQRQQSVSRAAVELGLTQAAVSAALGRLRSALGDRLLVRVGSGMQLTERARDLIRPVEDLCLMMDSLLQPTLFDPEKLERDFMIGTADWVALHVIARLVPLLRTLAPQVNLHFVDAVSNRAGLLASGDIDLIITPRMALSHVTGSNFHMRSLFQDRFVAVMAQHHPLAAMELPQAADFSSYRHIIYHYGLENWSEGWQHGVAGKPENAKVSLKLQQLSLMPMAALETGDIAITPKTLAEHMARWLPLQIVEVPGPPVILDMCMAWGALRDMDPTHIWLRNLIVRSMAGEL